MSGFLGADTEALRAHGDLVTQRARALLEIKDRLEPLVMDEAMWRGPDADQFRSDWSSRAANLFQLRSDDMTGRADQLRQHADEQDQVSEDGGAGAAGGSGGSGGSGGEAFNPLGFLADLAKKGLGLYNKLGPLLDYAQRIPNAFDEFGDLARHGLEGLWKQTYLDEAFKAGKGWQGAAEKLLGKLGLPTSIGKFKPLEVLNKLDDVAPWLKTTGSVLGKALPFVDLATGAHQLFTSDSTYDKISGGLSMIAGAATIAAPFTGPFAPVLLGIGAGAGVISAGMDIGKLVYDNWDGISQTVGNAASAVSTGVGNAASAVSEGIGNTVDAASEGLGNVASAVSDGIGNLGKAFGW